MAHEKTYTLLISGHGSGLHALQSGQGRLLAGLIAVARFQEMCTEGRAQRQCVNHRYEHSHGHRQTELRVEDTAGAAHEAHGDEHRHEDQRGSDERRGNITHGRERGRSAVTLASIKLCLRSFSHHYGIVDHRAYDQHQGEQRQRVERETRYVEETERAHQRHHNSYKRYQRGTPVTQEQQHHQHHQHHSLQQRALHAVDRGIQEVLGRHHVD